MCRQSGAEQQLSSGRDILAAEQRCLIHNGFRGDTTLGVSAEVSFKATNWMSDGG